MIRESREHGVACGTPDAVTVEAPHLLSAVEAIRRIRHRTLTASALLEACLAQIEGFDPALRAWTTVSAANARVAAARLDKAFATGQINGLLPGIPIGVKDIFNTADMPTAMGSPIWRGFLPGNDARVVTELRLAGAVVPGKTVTAEFAVHTPGETRNPHNPEHMPGTSSSGSAAAVAARMVPLAIGTQTAGSVIRPASYCGVFGFKPSFGLVPRTGSLKTTDSLDTVGWFGRTVGDVELLFDVLRVRGCDYPVSDARLAEQAKRVRLGDRWRVALVKGPKWADAEPYARAALERYAGMLSEIPGVAVEEAELPPGFYEAHEVHAAIYDKALSYYFKHEFQDNTLISPIMKDLIVHGQQTTQEQYIRALARQTELARALDRWFADRSDILLTLSTGGEALRGLDAVDRPDSCLIWTLCGVPALSLPVFKGPNGLPFGVQLAARRYDDQRLLRFAAFLCGHEAAPVEAPRPVLS